MNPIGKIDNISHFVNEDFGCHFKYKNAYQSVQMAKQVLNEMSKSGYKDIVVIESGTAPLIEIIKNLPEYKETKINFIQIKVPRELDFNLLDWFKTYLSETELNEKISIENKISSRVEILKELISSYELKSLIEKKAFTIYDSINDDFKYDDYALSKFNKVLEGTYLSKIFNSEFLVFDEYINAGTIIRNFNLFARLFSHKPNFKLSAYCMFAKGTEKLEKVEFSLYNKDSEFACYKNGAYPFENRIDLIGYYFYSGANFEKVYLKDLLNEFDKYGTLQKFNKLVENFIVDRNLLEKLRNSCEESQVREFVKKEDVARYIYKKLELLCFGQSKYYDFLDQFFELYAPAWSPMPVKNHLDYWNAFEKIDSEIVFSDIELQAYKNNRKFLFNKILLKLLDNREKWKGQVSQYIGEKI